MSPSINDGPHKGNSNGRVGVGSVVWPLVNNIINGSSSKPFSVQYLLVFIRFSGGWWQLMAIMSCHVTTGEQSRLKVRAWASKVLPNFSIQCNQMVSIVIMFCKS